MTCAAAIACFFAAPPARPTDHPTPSYSIYHPDPLHLWNRLHDALLVRRGPDGKTYGHDRLEPLLWPESKHLLHGPSHDAAAAVLQEFLKVRGEKLIDDPVKRAVLQRDLWLIFNWLQGSHSDFAEPKPDASAVRAAQEKLSKLVAAVIGRLALRPDEIRKLPDNYAAAVASGQFASRFDPRKLDRPYLPPDLFTADGSWVCVGRTEGITAPLHLAEGSSHGFNNSIFLVFLRLPAGRAATGEYLKTMPAFPKGTEVALVRRALLIDTSHRVVPSPLTESVQLRFEYVPSEFRVSRPQLFVDRAGGLRPVGNDESDFKTGFASHRWDEFEYRSNGRPFPGPAMRPIKQLCSGCHNADRFADLQSARLINRDDRPWSDLIKEMSIADVGASVVRWKAQEASWKALRKLLDH
jgi:hypothetical protein